MPAGIAGTDLLYHRKLMNWIIPEHESRRKTFFSFPTHVVSAKLVLFSDVIAH